MFKVIVAGGRDFKDYKLLQKHLNHLLSHKSEIEIVSGMARGADLLGVQYARENQLSLKQFPAEWDSFGNLAGYIRNVEMAQYADACVCFWNGKSNGTKHMIRIAKEHLLEVRIIKY